MPPRRRFLLALLVLLTSPVAGLLGHDARSGKDTCADSTKLAALPRPEDSLWMFSTRHLGCPGSIDPADPDFQILRRDANDGWQDSDWTAWDNSAVPQGLTVVYVHGNRTDWNRAFEEGMDAYRALIGHTENAEPIRFVIWSWPSTRVRGLRRDVQTKAARSDADAYYLALFLARLEPGTRVGLLGYSFGARIVSGALHLSGGGSLCGRSLPDSERPTELQVRVAMVAAAMHNHWWLPGHFHGRCLSQVERMLLLVNRRVPALHFYPMMERRSRPRALGYTGFPWEHCLGEEADRLEQRNVTCQIGKSHDIDRYFGSGWIMEEIGSSLLWQTP
jgi:hypothetical protein